MNREVTPRDQQLLEITRQLCQELNISNYNPTFVSWELQSMRSRGRSMQPVYFPADECLIEQNCITLSGRMKDVLESEDWKPIIASALIFSKKLKSSVLNVLLGSAAAFAALGALLLVWLPTALPQPVTVSKAGSSQTSPLGYLVAYTLLPVLILAAVIVSILYARRVRTKADVMAADLTGRASFIQTLNKIVLSTRGDPPDSRSYMGRATSVPLLPRIRDRIRRLELDSPDPLGSKPT